MKFKAACTIGSKCSTCYPNVATPLFMGRTSELVENEVLGIADWPYFQI